MDERIEQLLKILERYIDSSAPNKEKSKMLSEVGAEIVYHFLRTAENRVELKIDEDEEEAFIRKIGEIIDVDW